MQMKQALNLHVEYVNLFDIQLKQEVTSVLQFLT